MTGYDRFKRGLDIVIAAPALVVSAPIQVAIAVAVKRQLGSPVLFRQQRPGLHGKPFTEPDADRMTRFGTLLRSTSLDELPSLINVLRGEMSIVGPRPLLMEYLELYSPEQFRRHEVRPGVTGLAQVSGRNATTWDERFALDALYVDNRSLQLDASILVRTLTTVIKRDGISAEGSATMPKFRGGNPGPGTVSST